MIITKAFSPSMDTYIDSSSPNKNFSDLGISWVGRESSTTDFRYLVRFSLDNVPSNAEIISCHIKLYIDSIQDETIEGYFTFYPIISDWDYTAVTWNSQPIIDETVHSPSVNIKGISIYQWDITDIAKRWQQGLGANLGILLKDDDLKDKDNKRLISSRNPTLLFAHCRPKVIIQYSRRDSSCCESCFITGRQFTERFFQVETDDTIQRTERFDASQQFNISCFIKNTGLMPAEVHVEVSPNDTDYIVDSPLFKILPDEMTVLVPRIFSKFIYIAYKSKELGGRTQLEITIQSQV